MIDVDKLLELESKATPATWYSGRIIYDNGAVDMVSTDLGMINPLNHDHHICGVDPKKTHDAELIATMRNSIRELCLRLKAAEEVVDAAKEGMKFSLDPSTPRFDFFMGSSLRKYDQVTGKDGDND